MQRSGSRSGRSRRQEGEGDGEVIETCENNWALRGVYLVTAGYALGFVVAGVAGVFILSIIGMPVGLWLIDRMPIFISLRPECLHHAREWNYVLHGRQRPLGTRLLYFVFVGSWLSILWMAVAYALIFTVILIPTTFWMFDRVAQVATLYVPE